MKQLYYILLLLVLSVGLTTVAHEVQPNSRPSENLTQSTIGYSTSSCSVTASSNESLPATSQSYDNDNNNGIWTNIALCPNNLFTHNSVSSKILKLKLPLPVGLLQHIYSVRLHAKQNSLLTLNPHAIRYSFGYYIYALAHILI